MKNLSTIILGLLGVFGLVYFVTKKKGTTETAAGESLPDSAPNLNTVTDGKVYTIEDGEGKALIDNRVKQIYNSQQGKNILFNANPDFYGGLEWKAGMKEAMIGIFGDQNSIPVIPSTVNPLYLRGLKDLQETEDFEKINRQSGGNDAALTVWKSVSDFAGVNFWPSDIQRLIIEAKFGATNRADRDRSEGYDRFTKELKKLAANIEAIEKSYRQNLENQALRDLTGAGYKFFGYG